MRLARVLGAIGRGLISAGVIVLLFVAYQLWGTGIQNQQAQGNLADEAAESGIETEVSDEATLAQLAQESQEAIDEGRVITADPTLTLSDVDADEAVDSDDPDSSEADVADPGASLTEGNFDETERQAIIAKLYPEPGKPFARVVIPAINVDQISVEGVSVEDLRKGPGHYRTTPNPGQAGNAAIAGHRTTYGAPFHRVDELNPGDSIFVTTAQGTFHYKVKAFDDANGVPRGHFIVSPSETWVLGQDTGENLLTLTACHPKYSARQRIIVQAELVGDPVPTIPRDEAVDLGPVSIDSGGADERADGSDLAEGEVPPEEQEIIGQDVAVDGDPDVSLDEDGNVVDADGNIIEEAEADDEATSDDATSEGESGSEEDDDTEAASDDEEEAADDDDTEAASGSEADDATEAEANLLDEVEVSSNEAELTSAQTPFGDADDFGEGLNGDRTKIKPALMWGLAGLAIWVASWFTGHRLDRKWTLYAMGFVPFGFALWSTFVNVDQALPSY